MTEFLAHLKTHFIIIDWGLLMQAAPGLVHSDFCRPAVVRPNEAVGRPVDEENSRRTGIPPATTMVIYKAEEF